MVGGSNIEWMRLEANDDVCRCTSLYSLESVAFETDFGFLKLWLNWGGGILFFYEASFSSIYLH